MKFKIRGKTKEQLQDNIKKILNIACVVFRGGFIPNDYERKYILESGNYWYLNEKENKYELYPAVNNHKAFIREKEDNYIILEFYSRYGSKEQIEALTNLILLFFPDETSRIDYEKNRIN